MKKIIVLSGASNAGKTTTLNNLADHLSKMPGAIPAQGQKTPHVDGNDDQYYFDIAIPGVGTTRTRIGVSTYGDNVWCIKKGFDYFRKNNCDYCFIASKQCGCSISQIEDEAHGLGITPVYMFLIRYSDSRNPSGKQIRTWAQLQSDVVIQLASLIQ